MKTPLTGARSARAHRRISLEWEGWRRGRRSQLFPAIPQMGLAVEDQVVPIFYIHSLKGSGNRFDLSSVE